jgi:hypothetical protein
VIEGGVCTFYLWNYVDVFIAQLQFVLFDYKVISI